MPQVVENWSRISGTVESWDAPRSPGAEAVLTIHVDRVGDVPKHEGVVYPNLLTNLTGGTVRIRIPAAAVSRVSQRKGEQITLDVRRGRAPDALFAHPDVKK
jgi:hypothetical protein